MLQGEARAVNVGQDHVLPDLGISLAEATGLTTATGIGEHRINLAELGQRCIHHGFLIVAVLDIALDRQHLIGATQFLGQ